MQGDLCGAPHQKIDNSSLDVSKETLYFKFSWKLFFFFFFMCHTWAQPLWPFLKHNVWAQTSWKNSSLCFQDMVWSVFKFPNKNHKSYWVQRTEHKVLRWLAAKAASSVQIHKQEQSTKKALLHLQACSWRSTAKEEYPHGSSHSPARWALHANIITFQLYSWIPEPCEAASFPFDENQGSL